MVAHLNYTDTSEGPSNFDIGQFPNRNYIRNINSNTNSAENRRQRQICTMRGESTLIPKIFMSSRLYACADCRSDLINFYMPCGQIADLNLITLCDKKNS